MDASEYKAAKMVSNALRWDTFDSVLRVVWKSDPRLVQRVHSEATLEELAVPLQHGGATSGRWLSVRMPAVLAEEILDALSFAEAGAVDPDGSTTRAASATASLVDAWLAWIGHHEA